MANYVVSFIASLVAIRLSLRTIERVMMYGFKRCYQFEQNCLVPESIELEIRDTLTLFKEFESTEKLNRPKCLRPVMRAADVTLFVLRYLIYSTLPSSQIFEIVSMVVIAYATGLRFQSCVSIRVKDLQQFVLRNNTYWLHLKVRHLKYVNRHERSVKDIYGDPKSFSPLCPIYMLNAYIGYRFDNAFSIHDIGNKLRSSVQSEKVKQFSEEHLWDRNSGSLRARIRQAFIETGFEQFTFHSLRRGFVKDFVESQLREGKDSVTVKKNYYCV